MNEFVPNKHLCKIIDEYLFTKQPYLSELSIITRAVSSACHTFHYYSKCRINKIFYSERNNIISAKYYNIDGYWSITSTVY
jgi:hypothetical protein